MLLSPREEEEWSLVSDESPAKDLYGELQLTAKRFTDLAHRLQEKATTRQKVWKVDQSAQTDSCCDEIKMQLMESRAENVRLRQNLKDVTDINHRWNEYNTTRQKHVHYLQASLVELRETVAALRQKRDAAHSQSEEGPAPSTMKKIAGGRDEPSSSVAKKNEDRAERRSPKSPTGRTSPLHQQKTPTKHEGQSSEKLTSSYTDVLAENVKLSRHVHELQPQVASLRHRLQTSQEECELLRIQLKTYRNDWKSEQIEKEDALAKLRQINEELSTLKRKCHHYIDKIQISKASSDCLCQKGRRLSKMEKSLHLEDLLKSKVIEMNTRRRLHRHQQLDAIMCTVDGVQVRLLERCSGDNLVSENDCDIQRQNSTDPIVTFPSSDSCNTDAEENGETQSPTCAEANRTLLCPLCLMPFQDQCIEELLDHYKECKNFPSSCS